MELLLPSWGLILITIIGFACMALWFFILWDVVKSRFPGPNDKLLWVLVILFAPFIGAILYLSIGRRTKLNKQL
jgi:hypothetical protein